MPIPAADTATLTLWDGSALDDAQAAAVRAKLAETHEEKGRLGNWLTVAFDGAPTTRPHRDGVLFFAAFASLGLAYEIAPTFHVRESPTATWEYHVVLVHGQAVAEVPEEGQSGVLHLMRRTERGEADRWRAAFIPRRWLHLRELNESASTIARRTWQATLPPTEA